MITKDYFTNYKPYSEFSHWFRINVGSNTLVLRSKDNNHQVEYLLDSMPQDQLEKDLTSNGYIDDWNSFKERPEYYLYLPIEDFKNVEHMIDCYEKLLVASTMAIIESSGKDPDTSVPQIAKCLDWLRTTDFYTCPASRKYHDTCNGGLLHHTLKVVAKCRELMSVKTFTDTVNYAKAVRASLMHDWCKIGLYQQYMKNVKDESTDSWNSVCAYRYKDNRSVCLGHGTSSMFLASKFFSISYEEALAIRWHMGEFNVADSEVQELSQVCRMYPLVYILQFADRLSCVDY